MWDKFSGPVDQDAVRLEFFRKIHCKNPPFRIKVKLPPRNRVKVPTMVKYHYQKPVQLLPSLKDVLRLEYVLNREKINGEVDVLKIEESNQVQSESSSLCNGSEDQICDKSSSDDNTQREEDVDEGCKEDFMHRNGCIKSEVVNGATIDQKDNNFLPDVVSDITSEGEFLVNLVLSHWQQCF